MIPCSARQRAGGGLGPVRLSSACASSLPRGPRAPLCEEDLWDTCIYSDLARANAVPSSDVTEIWLYTFRAGVTFRVYVVQATKAGPENPGECL